MVLSRADTEKKTEMKKKKTTRKNIKIKQEFRRNMTKHYHDLIGKNYIINKSRNDGENRREIINVGNRNSTKDRNTKIQRNYTLWQKMCQCKT